VTSGPGLSSLRSATSFGVDMKKVYIFGILLVLFLIFNGEFALLFNTFWSFCKPAENHNVPVHIYIYIYIYIVYRPGNAFTLKISTVGGQMTCTRFRVQMEETSTHIKKGSNVGLRLLEIFIIFKIISLLFHVNLRKFFFKKGFKCVIHRVSRDFSSIKYS